MARRDALNEYDLGLPLPLDPIETRRAAVPAEVWRRLGEARERLAGLLGPRLRELRLFGSYARADFDDESDVDLLVLCERLDPGDISRIVGVLSALSGPGAIFTPLILTTAELDHLRARELILAEDLDREGIPV